MRGHAALTSSKKQDYGTPWWLYNCLDAEFHFLLDAAADVYNKKHENFFSIEDNALVQPWAASTFLNPPFNRTGDFIEKAKNEALERGCTVVVVCAARCDTQWWHNHIAQGATEVRLIKGRVNFIGGKHTATFPCAVIVFKPNPPPEPKFVHWNLDEQRIKTRVSTRKKAMPKKKKVKNVTATPKVREDGTVEIEIPVDTAPSVPTDVVAVQLSLGSNGSNGSHAAEGLMTSLFGPSEVEAAAPVIQQTLLVETAAAATPAITPVAFERMISNVKGISGPITFGKKNAVCGDNRQGKTAVLDALRLGVTGKHPVGPHAKNLIELAPAGTDEIDVVLESPLGSAKFSVTKGRKPALRPTFSGCYTILEDDNTRMAAMPATSVRDFLTGDRVAREAVFSRYGAGIVPASGVPVPADLDDTAKALWTATVSEVVRSGTTDVAEALAETVTKLRSTKTGAGSKVKALAQQLEELKGQIALQAAGSEQLPALQEQYQRARAYENLAQVRQDLANAEAQLQQFELAAQVFVDGQKPHDEKIGALVEELGRLSAKATAIQGRANDLDAEHAANTEALKRVEVIASVCDRMVAANVHTCPVCSSTHKTAQEMKATVDPIVEMRRQALTVYSQHKAELQQQALQVITSVRTIEATKQQMEAAREAERLRIKNGAGPVQGRVATLKKALSDAGGDYTGPTTTEIRATIESLQNADNLRAAALTLEDQISEYVKKKALAKSLEDKGSALLQSLLTQVASSAETAVNAFMPAGFVAKLDLTDGGCEWRVIGTDGRPYNKHTMCGSERSALLIALTLAWTSDAPMRVVTLDDDDIGPFHSTPANLQALLAKLGAAVDAGQITQLFVSGLRKDEVPAGWQTIQR